MNLKRSCAGINDDARGAASPCNSTSTSPPNWASAREPIERLTSWRNLGRCASVSTSYGSPRTARAADGHSRWEICDRVEALAEKR